LIDDIAEEGASDGGQPTTPLREIQMTNPSEEDGDEEDKAQRDKRGVRNNGT